MATSILKAKQSIKHVVVDTNILWHKDKALVVNPDFDIFWTEFSGKQNVELHIPEVVLGELEFQQATSALKALSRAEEALQEADKIIQSGTATGIKLSSEQIKQRVKEKLKKWTKANAAKIVPVPVHNVDWNKLIDSAIWRKPPFTFDAKEENKEKGFRDALILETVCIVCSQHADAEVVFVSNDYLLRTTAEKRISNKKFTVYETLDELKNDLRLQEQNLTNEIVVQIRPKIKACFFDVEKKTGLWFSETIRDRLQSQFKALFDEPPKPSHDGALMTGLMSIFSANKQWEAKTGGKFFISSPKFIDLESERTFHWVNTITWIREYREASGSLAAMQGVSPKRAHLHLLEFEINWACDVTPTGVLKNPILRDLKSPTKNSFVELTAELSAQYGIQE